MDSGNRVISSILKHDKKITSYKIALVRSINDVVLSYPDLDQVGKDIAVPLRLLAEFWVAYYFPFVDPAGPILQGPRSLRGGRLTQDMAFRGELTAFRSQWEAAVGGMTRPADGFYAIHELKLSRRRVTYPYTLLDAYGRALKKIEHTLQMPIRYAGPAGSQWSVFDRPRKLQEIGDRVIPIPGTGSKDVCIVIGKELWASFRQLSLWVEALCIHEWCLFSERIEQPDGERLNRGEAYSLLTARPNSRRPLTWERNQINVLMLEGMAFTCPWTQKRLTSNSDYDLDHILPVAIYPINELWNLVPADPGFNAHKKRARLPSQARLERASPILQTTYGQYLQSGALKKNLHEDAQIRFANLDVAGAGFSKQLTTAVQRFVLSVADARNAAQF